MNEGGKISGVPQRPTRKEESRLDLETPEFRDLFFTLLTEGYDQSYIVNYITRDPEIAQNVVINWFSGIHTPSDIILRKRILSALEEFQKSNPPITKKQTISQEQTSETPRFKRLKRPGLRDRARANKKRPDIVRQQEEGKGEERARIKSEEEYKALEKKLKGENKII